MICKTELNKEPESWGSDYSSEYCNQMEDNDAHPSLNKW